MVTAKPWTVLSVARYLTLLFICLLSGGLLRHALGVPPDAISWKMVAVNIMSFQVPVLVLTLFFLREHRTNLAEAFGIRVEGLATALSVALLVTCIVLPIAWLLQIASVHLMQFVRVEPVQQQAVEAMRTADTGGSRLLMGVAAILLAPVTEEILFRGIIYPTIKQVGYPRVALWGTALVFGLVHGNVASFIPLTFLAVTWTLVYERTGNLLAPIFMHCLFNGANFVMFYLFQTLSNRAALLT